MIIYGSQEDEAFIVKAPQLPGCMAEGSAYKEAVENAEVAIQAYIDTAEELGRGRFHSPRVD